MKLNFAATALLAAATLVGCSSPAVLTLHYNSPEETTLYQYRPINGVAAILTDTLILRGDTTVTQQIAAGDAAPYELSTTNHDRLFLILQDGKKSVVDISPSAKNVYTITDNSDDAPFERLYDSLRHTRNQYERLNAAGFAKAPFDTVGSVMAANFRALADGEIALYEALAKEPRISPEALALAIDEVNYGNALRMVSAINQNMFAVESGRMPYVYDGYPELLDSITTEYPVSERAARTVGLRYLQLIRERDFMEQRPNYKSEPEFMKGETHALDSIAAQMEPRSREAMQGHHLWWLGINNNSHNQTLDTLIAQFNERYPGSAYTPHLDRFVRENRAYNEIVSRPFSDKVHLIENPDSLATLEDVFALFKGKPIFVDFWFSSCGSCCDEFAHAAKMYEFLEQNGIVPLFISIDSPGHADAWSGAIKYYNLEGHHLRASSEMGEKSIYGKHNIYSYPTYMIIDKDGTIVEPRAKRPSDGEELFKQIREKLNL